MWVPGHPKTLKIFANISIYYFIFASALANICKCYHCEPNYLQKFVCLQRFVNMCKCLVLHIFEIIAGTHANACKYLHIYLLTRTQKYVQSFVTGPGNYWQIFWDICKYFKICGWFFCCWFFFNAHILKYLQIFANKPWMHDK